MGGSFPGGSAGETGTARPSARQLYRFNADFANGYDRQLKSLPKNEDNMVDKPTGPTLEEIKEQVANSLRTRFPTEIVDAIDMLICKRIQEAMELLSDITDRK